ncbi:MAG TPA: 2,3-bisphosphoglycerate-independent phosphoglycerate mutase [Dehalococcoidia bacterium]|nr:2,3-bisphosphoglycerate-independent phosphoglycerate mutase [Dehalococcoidia bacterium]
MDLELARQLATEADTKIVLVVMDGLGGLPHPETGRTELEAAYTPNLDRLARESMCGLTVPVAPGVTPGSGPGHLALFGYDPLRFQVGRGVLEALGIDFDLQPGDVAARGNFCTVDEAGIVTDRRAGRIDSERCAQLVAKLRGIQVDGVQVLVEPVREHRFLVVLRGEGLSDRVSDTDPQREGAKVPPAVATAPEGERTASLVNRFVAEAARRLQEEAPANMLLLRGFAMRPHWPTVQEVFRLRAAAVAYYPMYRGLGKLVGMQPLPSGPRLEDAIASTREHWHQFDYFFLHYKATDTAGEDGDFDRKVEAIEAADRAIPALLDLDPDVLIVTGDHSTPAVMAGHSWHPVPFMMRARWARADDCDAFNEVALQRGILGTFPAVEVMPLALAHARRLLKFGA